MTSRNRDEWAEQLERLAESSVFSDSRKYYLECASAIRCPDRTSFQGVRLTDGPAKKK